MLKAKGVLLLERLFFVNQYNTKGYFRYNHYDRYE